MAVQVVEGANFQFVRNLQERLGSAVSTGDKLRASVAEFVEENGHLDTDLAITRSSLQKEIQALRKVAAEAIGHLRGVKTETCCGAERSSAKVWSFWGAEHLTWALSIGAGVVHFLDPAASKVAGVVSATANFIQGSCSRLGKHQLNKRATFETAVTELVGIRDTARRAIADFGSALAFYEADAAVELRLSPQSLPSESKLDTETIGLWLVEELKRIWGVSVGTAPLSREEIAARWLSRLSRDQLTAIPPFGDTVEGLILEEARENRLRDLASPMTHDRTPSGALVCTTPPPSVCDDEVEVVVEAGCAKTPDEPEAEIEPLLAGPQEAFILDMERELDRAAASGDTIRAFAGSHARETQRRRHNYSMHIGMLEGHVRTLTRLHQHAEAILGRTGTICGVEADRFKDRVLTAAEYAVWFSNLTLGISTAVSEGVEELRVLNIALLFGQAVISNASTRMKQSIVAKEKLMGRFRRLRDESDRLLGLFRGSIAILQGCPIERSDTPEIVAASLERTLREQARARLRPTRVLARRLVEAQAERSTRDVTAYPYPDTRLGRMLRDAAERVTTHGYLSPRAAGGDDDGRK
ncbi:MAG: hypothetical protein SP1CHLAM54_01390 [Chlamydiia bacterium]|nr:hypothetical protein [Chlamydiia bacterium]MCH9615059.1 hypothetical protein [Chlamydiia bacterium]MCH9629891.1 hypothetical protein [Chlamydiia bacterium]